MLHHSVSRLSDVIGVFPLESDGVFKMTSCLDETEFDSGDPFGGGASLTHSYMYVRVLAKLSNRCVAGKNKTHIPEWLALCDVTQCLRFLSHLSAPPFITCSKHVESVREQLELFVLRITRNRSSSTEEPVVLSLA